MTQLAWTPVAPGCWRARVGPPETLTPLSVVGAKPRVEALQAMGDAPFPLEPDATWAEHVHGRTVVCLPLDADEALFGFGLQFMRMNHRTRTRYLRVNSDPKEDTGETHAPVPFYVSSRGYGVLANTSRIATVYCGSCARKADTPAPVRDMSRDPDFAYTTPAESVEIAVNGESLELYLFAGPSPLEAVRRYNLYCGGGVLPPRWGLGFWHRAHFQYTAEQVQGIARGYRERGFPCDVMGLEPGWQSGAYPCTYEWGEDRFPDPDGFLRWMRGHGFHVNLWEHAWVSPHSPIYNELMEFSGSHTVWGGLAPDYTLPEARRILKQHHDRAHLSIGVSGYKLDECDGSELTELSWMFPAHATFPSGHDGEQMRQVYGLLMQRMTAELFHARDRRTYGLVRASNAGASSLPYVLYSDLYDHRQFVRALCNSGISGILWAPEVREAKTPEEWARRMQVACFSPLAMLSAWNNTMCPWSFTEVEAIVRRYIELRMRLLPYFYSAFARYHFDGTPPFRPMALVAGPEECADIDDQYMAGDSLLVAPLFSGESSRDVWLPEGAWYDFDTGERFAGGRTVRISAGVEKLPLFVRDGGIIPLMPPLPHAPSAGDAVPLEVRHYGTAPGRFDLFDDDGETFAYEDGAYLWRTLEVTVAPDGSYHGSISPAPEDWQSSYSDVTWVFIGKP